MNREVYQEIYQEIADQKKAFERIGELLQKIPVSEVINHLEKMEAALEFFIQRMLFSFRNEPESVADGLRFLLYKARQWEKIGELAELAEAGIFLKEYFEEINRLFSQVISAAEDIPKNDDRIGLVLIVKNEERYIPEWIEYHKTVGISRFFIYDNESTDRTREVLQQYIDEGSVVYTWCPGLKMQLHAYADALDRFRFEVKYMGFIDTDEFILPVIGSNVPDLVDKIFSEQKEAGGITVNWRIFGSDGVIRDDGKPVIGSFLHRAKDSFWQHQHYKSICDPRKTLYPLSPHRFWYVDGKHSVNERGGQVDESYDMSGVNRECRYLQINHYYVKSREYWEKVKLRRPFADTDGGYTDKYFDINDRNEVEDSRMLQFLPLVEERLKNRGFL